MKASTAARLAEIAWEKLGTKKVENAATMHKKWVKAAIREGHRNIKKAISQGRHFARVSIPWAPVNPAAAKEVQATFLDDGYVVYFVQGQDIQDQHQLFIEFFQGEDE